MAIRKIEKKYKKITNLDTVQSKLKRVLKYKTIKWYIRVLKYLTKDDILYYNKISECFLKRISCTKCGVNVKIRLHSRVFIFTNNYDYLCYTCYTKEDIMLKYKSM